MLSFLLLLLLPSSNLSFSPSLLAFSPAPPATRLFSGAPDSPLITLQVLLQIADVAPSGGSAKALIQGSRVLLNGKIETRRGKKLYAEDTISVDGADFDVAEIVASKEYVMAPPKLHFEPPPSSTSSCSTPSPVPAPVKAPVKASIDAATPEFGGEFRSDEFRAARKAAKLTRRNANKPPPRTRYSQDNSSRTDVPQTKLSDIQHEIDKRTAARAARDFAASDEMRDKLVKAGVTVDDERRLWWFV